MSVLLIVEVDFVVGGGGGGDSQGRKVSMSIKNLLAFEDPVIFNSVSLCNSST